MIATAPRIYEVPARGGEPQLLFEPERAEEGAVNSSPHFLPLQAGARSIVLEIGSLTDRDIAVKNLETGEWELLAEPRYDVSADSRRFVLIEPVAVAEEKPPSIHIVENWYEEFRAREQH